MSSNYQRRGGGGGNTGTRGGGGAGGPASARQQPKRNNNNLNFNARNHTQQQRHGNTTATGPGDRPQQQRDNNECGQVVHTGVVNDQRDVANGNSGGQPDGSGETHTHHPVSSPDSSASSESSGGTAIFKSADEGERHEELHTEPPQSTITIVSSSDEDEDDGIDEPASIVNASLIVNLSTANVSQVIEEEEDPGVHVNDRMLENRNVQRMNRTGTDHREIEVIDIADDDDDDDDDVHDSGIPQTQVPESGVLDMDYPGFSENSSRVVVKQEQQHGEEEMYKIDQATIEAVAGCVQQPDVVVAATGGFVPNPVVDQQHDGEEGDNEDEDFSTQSLSPFTRSRSRSGDTNAEATESSGGGGGVGGGGDALEQDSAGVGVSREAGGASSEESSTLADSEVEKLMSPGRRVAGVSTDELPNTVTVLRAPNNVLVYVVGTAHFSQQSQVDVVTTIERTQPTLVLLELCSSRRNILSLDEETVLKEVSEMNFQKVRLALSNSGTVQGTLHLLLLSMSAQLTRKLGMAPGGEFRAAMREARKIPGCVLLLGDRPFNITISRALAALTFFQKIKLAWQFLTSNEDITREEIEKCKEKDLLERMLTEMTGEFPTITEVFVNERDVYLAHSLYLAATSDAHRSNGGPIVGVVGMGHVAGIVRNWGKTTDESVTRIIKIPETPLSSLIIRKTMKVCAYGLFGYGLFRVGKRVGGMAGVDLGKVLSDGVLRINHLVRVVVASSTSSSS